MEKSARRKFVPDVNLYSKPITWVILTRANEKMHTGHVLLVSEIIDYFCLILPVNLVEKLFPINVE